MIPEQRKMATVFWIDASTWAKYMGVEDPQAILLHTIGNIYHNAAAHDVVIMGKLATSKDFERFGAQGRTTKRDLGFEGMHTSRTGEMLEALCG